MKLHRALFLALFLPLASSAGAQTPRNPNRVAPHASPSTIAPSVPGAGAPSRAGGVASQTTPPSSNTVTSTPAPDVPAYAGTLAQGLSEMEHLSDAEKNEDALRIGDELLAPNAFLRWKARASAEAGWKKTLVGAADPVLDALGWNGAEPAERAAVHYAKGVVRSRAGQRAEAEAEFEAARTLAGPGELRLDAIYNLGTADLMEGEARRAEIPELKGGNAGSSTPGATPVPPAIPPNAVPSASGTPGAGAQPADPLELAKQAYLRAREHYVERLKADWRDADARANTELVARRLKELEELKKKREEQKKEQEKEKQDDKDKKPNDKDKQKQDSKDKQDSKKDQDKKDPSKDGQQDKKDDQKQDQPKPDDKKPDDKKNDAQDEKKPDDAQDKDKDPKEAQPGNEKEQLLTKEEVMRLLDRLNQIEEQAKQMQMQLRHSRRAKVKKDW